MSEPFRPRDIPSLLADRYEVEIEIGSGAFATTYRGRDRRLDRIVAIKILSRDYARDETYVQRFEREAQTAASISNGNVVDVYDFGQQGEILYIVMQYIAGEDLKHLIVREGSLAPDRAREITLQILSGLGAIHQAGIVHRDIKPQNILIGTDGQARVADFGIAQVDVDTGLTSAGSAIGTAAYMAPEQAQGGRTTPATDLYAVGVVLYEMLTGVLPFTAPTSMAMMLAHIQQHAAPPSLRANGRPIPADLDGIVMQALAKDPRDRFRSAQAMAQALRGASTTVTAPQATQSIEAQSAATSGFDPGPVRSAPTAPISRGAVAGRTPPPPTRLDWLEEERRRSGPKGVVAGLLLAVLIGVVAVGAYFWWDHHNSGGAPDAPTATATSVVTATVVSQPTGVPTGQPAPTADSQLIEPQNTVAPEPTATDVPTEVPPTSVPPTQAPPTTMPTVAPSATSGVVAPEPSPTAAVNSGDSPPIQPIGTQAGQ
jgi:serine/threonine-protein kinase